MQTFKEFYMMSESFDTKPAKWELVRDNDAGSIYRFNIDNNIYLVFFTTPMRDNKPTTVDFGIHDNKTNNVIYTMTDTGNAFEVLMTVLDTIRDYIDRKDPYGIVFSARKAINDKDSKSRSNVYKRLIQKFAPSQYKLNIADKGFEVYYTLSKT